MPNKNLPIYQALISKEIDNELEVDCVALVDKPAIERLFTAFSSVLECKFSEIDTTKRIVIGPAMIPDMLIYRNNKEIGEHQVYFTKETIQDIAQKFYALGYHKNGNEMHNPELKINGMNYFMSFIRNSEKGVIGLAGDYPEGTWFLGAKIDDDAVWGKVASGEYKGFSVEGYFEYVKHEDDAADVALLEQIEQLAVEDTAEALEKISALIFGTKK